MNELHKRRVHDVTSSMLKDLNEIGLALGSKEQVIKYEFSIDMQSDQLCHVIKTHQSQRAKVDELPVLISYVDYCLSADSCWLPSLNLIGWLVLRVKYVVIGTGGREFDYRLGKIGHVPNGSPPLRHCFGAVLPRR